MSLPADGGGAAAYGYAVGEEERTSGGRRLEDGERLRVLLRTNGVSHALFATASGLSLVDVATMCAAERIEREKRERSALIIEGLVRSRSTPLQIVGNSVALVAAPDHGLTEAKHTPSGRVRARTTSIKRLSKRELERGRLMYPASEHAGVGRPRERGDCEFCPTCQEWRDAQNGSAEPAGVRGVGGDDSAVHQPQEQAVPRVRSAGDRSLPSVAIELLRVHLGHGAATDVVALDRASEQRRVVHTGELRVGDEGSAESEPPILRPADGRWPHATPDGMGTRARDLRGDDPQAAPQGVGRLSCGHDTREALFHSRPCAFVGCSSHLYLDVNEETGSIKENFPDIGADELHLLPDTCSLDIADRGGLTLEEVGAVLGLTRERVRQIEGKSIEDLKGLDAVVHLRDDVLGEAVQEPAAAAPGRRHHKMTNILAK